MEKEENHNMLKLINDLVIRRSDKIKLDEKYQKYIELLGLIKSVENLSKDFDE